MRALWSPRAGSFSMIDEADLVIIAVSEKCNLLSKRAFRSRVALMVTTPYRLQYCDGETDNCL